MLKCFWLGLPLVQVGKRSIKLETRKATALLAYLSLTPHGSSREILATMFWPDYDQSRALANLRRSLASLNTNLPPGTLEADREIIRWNDLADRWLDVEEFHQAVKKVHSHCTGEWCEECLKALEAVVGLYRGEFLEGMNLKDSPEFDEWQARQRREHQRVFGEILGWLSEGYARCDQVDLALGYARRWVALDRLHEPALRCMVRMLMKAGRRSEARREYDEFHRLLSEQVGQAPDEETLAIYRQIEGDRPPPEMPATPGAATSFPLLKTKLHIPPLPNRRVTRQTLLCQLDRIPEKSLTIISAPAGFGKTTLLAEWIRLTHLSIAWLSLDTGDNDPYRFLEYLITALDGIAENLGREAIQLIHAAQPIPVHIILASLINDLGMVREPFVLILDDYQFITTHPVHEALSYLLDHLPINMHVVISTRSDPPLQFSRLRANDRILEVRTRDLRFTPQEAVSFLSEVMGMDLQLSDIEALEARTEGWVVGLKMAALSLSGKNDVSKAIRAFSGSNRYILDYLVEEVLAGQPHEIQRFLLNTSILERLTAPLCDALLGNDEGEKKEADNRLAGPGILFTSQSASILEYLERANLFLVPLDDERIWYRFHHLFADLLKVQLQKSFGAQGVAQLHIRASDWLAKNGSVQEAIQHASWASDEERVEHFIEQHYMELVDRGEQSWLRLWTGKLSRELVHRRPWLCIYEAYSHAWFGELDEAERLLEVAGKHLQSEHSLPDQQAILGLHSYVKSRVMAMRGDIHHAIEFCTRARKFTAANNLALLLDTGITLGYEYFLDGDYANARPILEETIRTGVAVGAVLNPVAGACILARLDAVQGSLKRSHETYQMGARSIPEASGQHLGARALIEVGIAELFYEWNDLEACHAHIRKGLEHLPLWGKADDLALAYTTVARINLALSDLNDAGDAVEKAIRFVQERGVFSEACHAVELARINLWLAQGDMLAANHWASSLDKQINQVEFFRYEYELLLIARARVWLFQHQPDEAIGLLSQLETHARSAGRFGRVIEILLLKALAYQDMGDPVSANLALQEGLVLAGPENYVRIFLDKGEPMQELLDRFRLSAQIPQVENYVHRLLTAFAACPA